MLGPLVAVRLPRLDPHLAPQQYITATRQRGGIDSDPMVRVLAYRAWKDRDRGWFERPPPILAEFRYR